MEKKLKFRPCNASLDYGLNSKTLTTRVAQLTKTFVCIGNMDGDPDKIRSNMKLSPDIIQKFWEYIFCSPGGLQFIKVYYLNEKET
jgi:hypothetical protein